MKKFALSQSAARKFKAIVNGHGERSSRIGGGTEIFEDIEYPLPFSITWAASVGDSGSWIIWLPSNKLVTYAGSTVDIFKDLTPAGGDYPDGWYRLAALDESAAAVYLNILITAGVASISFTDSPASASAADSVVPILLSTIHQKVVKPSVTSAIVYGGGGGELEVTGTDNVTVKGSKFVFTSASDSNVEVKFSKDSKGLIFGTIGVYWTR